MLSGEGEMKKYDLVVAGGGLAGVCGAISAKRMGLSTCIIQDRPVFGGNASSEIRVNIGGACACNAWARETGIISEIFFEERKRNFEYHLSTWEGSILDMVIYDFLRREGVDIYLNTSVRKAIMKSNNIIKGIYCVQIGSEREFALYGDYFLDATGDGTLGFSAGAEFRIGREGKDEFGEELAPEKPDMGIMGNSLLFLIKDVGRPVRYTPPDWAIKYEKDDVCLKMRGHNYKPGYWWIEIGFPFDTISDNEEIKHNLLAHVFGIWDHMKNAEDHGFENFVLEWVGMVPGKRESRRLVGDYILTEKDVKERKNFEDAIAYGGWFIDLHTPGGILAKEEPPEPTVNPNIEIHLKEVDKRYVYLYSIPYRCVYSKNIKNLFMAGRNISVSHIALGTIRVMGTCAILGQAVGVAAYLCRKYHCFPFEIYEKKHYKELQQILLKEGCFIPDIKNEDKGDIFLHSKCSVSSERNLKFDMTDGEIKPEFPVGQKLPLNGRVEKIKFKIKVQEDTLLKFHLRSSEDIWDFMSREDILYKEVPVKKDDEEVSVDINKEFEKGIYWFYFEGNEKVILKTTTQQIPGCALIVKPREVWLFERWSLIRNIYFEITPPLYPFSPDNTVNGVSRPERWTNAWISDNGLPQWIEFDFGKERELNYIQFIFDHEVNVEYSHIPPFYIPHPIPQQYGVFYLHNGKWKALIEEVNNTGYFVRHRFKTIKTERIRVEFYKTNGAEYVVVYEVRGGKDDTGIDG